MINSQRIKWLKVWAEKIQTADAALDSIQKLFDSDYESPALKPICELMSAFTDAVSEIVGDECEWLDYYRHECQLGAHPLMTKHDGLEIKMDSLDALLNVISR